MHPHEQLVTDMLDARYARNDLEEAARFFHPEVVWHMFAGTSHPFTGDFIGVSGLAVFARLLDLQTDGTFTLAPDWVRAVGEHLVASQLTATMKVNEREETILSSWVCRVENGKIAEVWDIIAGIPASVVTAAENAVTAYEEDPR